MYEKVIITVILFFEKNSFSNFLTYHVNKNNIKLVLHVFYGQRKISLPLYLLGTWDYIEENCRKLSWTTIFLLLTNFRIDSPTNRDASQCLLQEVIQDNGGENCEYPVSEIKCK